jgi:glutamyl-tRNA reductase
LKQANNQSILFAFGVNYKTASIEVREKVYVHDQEKLELLNELKKTLKECIIVSTCNRTEIYGLHPSANIDFDYYKDLLINFKNAEGSVKREDFFSSVSCAACEQLFSISTSIESKIVGDTQILQQVRDAYKFAKDNGFTGKIINQLFQRALKIGKKTYLETSIHKGAVSISLAAVELARSIFDSLHDKTVLIIGAGETARLTAECLLKKRIGKILVTNRTRAHAEDFLADLRKSHNFEGEVVDFERFRDDLNQTDIVISSTSSPDYLLYAQDFESQNRKILLIDIAVPRDISPGVAENDLVVLKNIDDLNTVVDKNFEKRMLELARVKKIVYQEMADFLVWYYSLPLLPAACKSGAKVSSETVGEIKQIKEFLAANASWFHRMARQKDVRSELKEHQNLVNYLYSLKQANLGEVGFEK